MTHIAAIALGSNLASPFGSPADNLRGAIRRIGVLGEVAAVSSFHETAPVGYIDQPNFVNAALLLRTELLPPVLLESLLGIERAMGRDRSVSIPPKGPRIIDLDLLLYDAVILNTAALTLPHPEMHTRRFVLAPLAEIAPEMIHPVSGSTVADLLLALG